ncbi:hypothetical protein AZ14_1708 [Bordetella bronchiseptica 980]|nr:hypothetical protein AZ14_1708 [Bordetella bronchiseptica 980]
MSTDAPAMAFISRAISTGVNAVLRLDGSAAKTFFATLVWPASNACMRSGVIK